MTIQEIRDSYGVNHRISGEYDRSLAVTCHNGTFVGKYLPDGIKVYKGIPYARPPVGVLRWKKPVLAGRDAGIFEAYYNGKSPIQTEWVTEQASYYPQGEDCLYLNIWVNPRSQSREKTVMVFIHGGSYGWGGTADPLYDGAAFVRENPDIIMVTIGYRTGLMGFIDFSMVPGGEDYPDAPNLGIWDQIAALRWVKKNIQAFGGKPDRVTIFGESAGGGSVSLLPITPAAKGLFRRVIAESGSIALTFSKEECQSFTRRVLEASGAKTMDDLTQLSEDKLREINEKVNLYNNFPQRDGILIPEDPYESYRNGETSGFEMMMGTNANEVNYWVGELGGIVPYRLGMPILYEKNVRAMTVPDQMRAKRFIDSQTGHPIWRMTEFSNELLFRLPMLYQAEAHSRHGGKVFIYYWKKPSTIPYRGACHAVELAYVFGNIHETIYTGETADKSLSRRVMHMWANFARRGDPSTEEVSWDEYKKKRSTMVIGDRFHTEHDLLADQRKLLMPLLRYRMNGSYGDVNFKVPFVFGIAGVTAFAVLGASAIYMLLRKK